VPPIIDWTTFHKAAERGRENQAFAPRNLKAQAYLLRKLVRCGRCGSSCSANTSKQTYQGTTHASHYYVCLRKHSGYLKQERCTHRHIRADVLDEWVWEEVNHRLQHPDLVIEGYQQHQAKRRESTRDEPGEATERLDTQIKSANRELSRLLDAYQEGAIELAELQKRRRLVDAKLETLRREKDVLARRAAEQKKETDVKTALEEFATLVAHNLKHMSLENKQKLLRLVLDKVVVKDWRVYLYYKIPLPRSVNHSPDKKVSSQFDFRSTCTPLCGLRSYVAPRI